MASDQSFVDYVCEQMRDAQRISSRKMFGEYAVYSGEKIVALVCDNQLFVKQTAAGREMLGAPIEAPPYPGAKLCFLIESKLDDAEFMSALIVATERELPGPKPKAAKKSKSAAKKATSTTAPKSTAKAKPKPRKK